MPLLTKKEIDLAKKNGIRYHTVCTRVYSNGWAVEEAITLKPKKLSNPWAKWKGIAEANQINSSAFYNRIKQGWPAEDAATHPLLAKGKNRRGNNGV